MARQYHTARGQQNENYTKEKWAEVNGGLMAIFAEFAACKDRGAGPDSSRAQMLVSKLQVYITENYYTCTDEILKGLGQMYIADGSFKENIDKHGEGTANFVYEAISVYFNPMILTDDPVLEKYWGDRKYKQLQYFITKQDFSKQEKTRMSAEIIKYVREKGYTVYHDFMDDISESHPDWFNMLTFDKNYNKVVLMYIKGVAKRR